MVPNCNRPESLILKCDEEGSYETGRGTNWSPDPSNHYSLVRKPLMFSVCVYKLATAETRNYLQWVTKLATNGKLRVLEGGVPVVDGYTYTVTSNCSLCVFIVNQTVQYTFILTEISSYKRRC